MPAGCEVGLADEVTVQQQAQRAPHVGATRRARGGGGEQAEEQEPAVYRDLQSQRVRSPVPEYQVLKRKSNQADVID